MEVAVVGADPRQLEKERRKQQEAAARNTYGTLSEKFMKEHVHKHLRPSTAREYQRILFGPDTKHWRTRPISSILQRDLKDQLVAIQNRASKGASALTLAYLSKFFNWCVEEEDAIASPPTALAVSDIVLLSILDDHFLSALEPATAPWLSKCPARNCKVALEMSPA